MAQAPESTDRPDAAQIHDRAQQEGEESLTRTSLALAISGLTAGLLMGLSGFGVAIVLSELGESGMARTVAMTLYPLGFIAVIVGRAQLFTENTLFPIVVLFDDKRRLLDVARVWGVVLAANLAGCLLFAALAMETGSLRPDIQDELSKLGEEAVTGDFVPLFFSGVVGGWLVALAAWLVLAADTAFGRVALIFFVTFPIGLAGLAHSIASSAEILSAVVDGAVEWSSFGEWLVPAVLGNAVGGVVIVSMLNHGQVAAQ